MGMDNVLKGQIALVTGASSGIGTGVALSMAAAGATVIVNHSSESSKLEADAVLKAITDKGGAGMVVQCDVTQEEQVIQMFDTVVAQYGTVDILVNNAGLQRDAKFDEMTLDQWNP